MKIVREIVLIDSTANIHGRQLVQRGKELHVLSGCCAAGINAEVYIDRMRQTWTQCSNCETLLDCNDRGWLAVLGDVGNYTADRPSSWAPWGKFWFGFDDFEMKVTV
jgi:hypothetical protein